jgi:tetratricopeptide (TPR) repeat protein
MEAIPQHKITDKPQPQNAQQVKPLPVPAKVEPAHDKLVAVPTLKQPEPLNSPLDGDLVRARKAYWANDYARAIDEYQRLIKRHPQNPDYLGELGNIYYTLNNDQRAAELYFEAAMLFLQQNNEQHARSLLAPITALNRELGERLQQRLNH